ncbi:MAG: GlsB/YeaQ/YmgE family stress response membrane protein [Calditrichaeota bacterium]|nr:MAG: GlsB/YeaQ/YmgE family stress response membrane protein [Calditrichota bacterium]
MGLLTMILIGLFAGAVARFILPGKQNLSIIMTILLGIAGSFVAGFLGNMLNFYKYGEGPGIIGSIVGALIILIVYGQIRKRR